MKKAFKVIGGLLLVIIIIAAVFIIMYQPKKYDDFGVFANLKDQIYMHAKEYNIQQRPITAEFENFSLRLSLPYNKLFGCNDLGVPLKAFQNEKIATATISQFEVPATSSYYRDFTLNIRPRFGLKAPVLHIDFMKPAPGTPGLCTMDFFNVDKENISLEDFFGEELQTIKKAYAMVEKYQRTVEEGRGKITKYLDPYKSAYRFELIEPKTDDVTLRKEYYQTAEKAIALVFSAYFKRLHAIEPDPAFARQQEEQTKELIRQIYTKDFAVSMGRKFFKEHFRKYWLDGFWNVDVALVDSE